MMESAVSSLGINTLEKRFPKGDVLLDIYSYLINTRTPLELHLEQNFPHFMMFGDGDRERVPPLQGAQARRERDGLRRPARVLEGAARRSRRGRRNR